MTEQKPYAWAYEMSATGLGPWTGGVCIHEPVVGQHIRRVEPLFKHPPTPDTPVTTPEVEAARREALKVILSKLDYYSECSDWAPIVLNFGVLRDLAGQSRKDA